MIEGKGHSPQLCPSAASTVRIRSRSVSRLSQGNCPLSSHSCHIAHTSQGGRSSQVVHPSQVAHSSQLPIGGEGRFLESTCRSAAPRYRSH